MATPLKTAPALPAGSVDFDLFHELVRKGDPDAAAKATVRANDPAPPPPIPAATKATPKAG